MIDNGQMPLARVDAFGNFWHGYRTTAGAYRSRAGAVMPSFPAIIAEIGAADAHLVNFNMPAVSTPAQESAKGMERWNKAILHGHYKRYAINAIKEFGVGGWPYRCADGTVYYLKAVCTFSSPNVMQVRAIKLDAQFTQPIAVAASIQVPKMSAVDTLNFSPDGRKAAAHSYINYTNASSGNLSINWIVEAAVSAGSATALPTVSLTLGYTAATANVYYDDPSPLIHQAYVVPGTPVVTYTTYGANLPRKITTTPWIMVVPTTGQTRPLWQTSLIDCITMVVYDASGGRHVLATGSGARSQEDNWSEFVSILPHIEYDDGAPNPPYVVQSATFSFKIHYQTRQTRRISRDGVQQILLESVFDRTIRLDCHEVSDYGYSSNDVQLSSAYSGNAVGAWGNALDTSNVVRFAASASNVLTMINETLTFSLIGYVSASGSNQWAYDAKVTLNGNIYPAVNPLTGLMDTSITHYF